MGYETTLPYFRPIKLLSPVSVARFPIAVTRGYRGKCPRPQCYNLLVFESFLLYSSQKHDHKNATTKSLTFQLRLAGRLLSAAIKAVSEGPILAGDRRFLRACEGWLLGIPLSRRDFLPGRAMAPGCSPEPVHADRNEKSRLNEFKPAFRVWLPGPGSNQRPND